MSKNVVKNNQKLPQYDLCKLKNDGALFELPQPLGQTLKEKCKYEKLHSSVECIAGRSYERQRFSSAANELKQTIKIWTIAKPVLAFFFSILFVPCTLVQHVFHNSNTSPPLVMPYDAFCLQEHKIQVVLECTKVFPV